MLKFNRAIFLCLAKKIESNKFVYSLSLFALRISNILLSVVLARLLSKEDFYIFASSFFSIQVFSVVVALGMPSTNTRYAIEYKNDDLKKLKLLRGTSYGLCFGATCFLVPLLYGLDSVWPTINLRMEFDLQTLFFILAILFNVLTAIENAILIGVGLYKENAHNNFINSGVLVSLSCAGGYFFGISGVLAGIMVAYTVTFLNARDVTSREIFKNINIIRKDFKFLINKLIKFSLPSYLAGLLVLPVIWISQSILISHDGKQESGAFIAIYLQWFNAMQFIPGILATFFLPKVFETLQAEKEKELKNSLLINFIFSILSGVILILMENQIFNLYNGRLFDGPNAFRLFVLAAVMAATSTIVGQFIVAIEKMWLGYISNMLWASTTILVTYFLVQSNVGVISVAIAFNFAYIAHTAFQFAIIKNYFKNYKFHCE